MEISRGQTAVGRKVYVVWRNDKYEKCSQLCELFENYNLRRTPRNNSSQNNSKIYENDDFSPPKIEKSQFCLKFF